MLVEEVEEIIVPSVVARARRRVLRQGVARVDRGTCGGVNGVVSSPPMQTSFGVSDDAEDECVILVGGSDIQVGDVEIQHEDHVFLGCVLLCRVLHGVRVRLNSNI